MCMEVPGLIPVGDIRVDDPNKNSCLTFTMHTFRHHYLTLLLK